MPRISFDFVGRDNLSGAIKSAKANLKSLETEGKQLDAAYKKVSANLLDLPRKIDQVTRTIREQSAAYPILGRRVQEAANELRGAILNFGAFSTAATLA